MAHAHRRIYIGAALLVAGITGAHAQEYPVKPIRIVTFEAGGGSDIVSRLIAQGLSARLGQQVIVENRVGVIAVETGAKAVPDGYTLLLGGSVIWTEPLLRKNVPWDAQNDFAPVTSTSRSPNMLVVHPSLPVTSVKELIALARSRPGELNYGSAGSGSTTHLAGELFMFLTGTKVTRIAYRGNSAAMTNLMGGHLQIMFPSVGEVTPHVKAGRVRPLAVTTAQVSSLAPNIPTVTDSGLPGYESASVLGILAPARTPPAIVNRLNQEIVQILNYEATREKFFSMGFESLGSNPEQFSGLIKSEIAKWGKVIGGAGLAPQ
jgi:tripartite-type tricarboxylate transporter receptor subunit TctC